MEAGQRPRSFVRLYDPCSGLQLQINSGRDELDFDYL